MTDWTQLQTGDVVNGYKFIGTSPSQRQNPAAWQPVHGEEYLQTLPPAEASAVKAYASGKWPFPQGFALKAPVIQRLIAAASQYDPTFDAASFPTRAATRKAFIDGPQGQNLINLNQAVGHAFELAQDIPKVAGYGAGSAPPQGNDAATALATAVAPVATDLGLATTLNNGLNTYESGKGNSPQATYNANVLALATELANVFKGKGSSAEAEIDAFKNAMDINASASQKYATLQRVTSLLRSRLDELGTQYVQGMGTTAGGIKLLNPQAEAAFDYLSNVGNPGVTPPKIKPGDIQVGAIDDSGNMVRTPDAGTSYVPVPKSGGIMRPQKPPGAPATQQSSAAQARPSTGAPPPAAIQLLKQHPEYAPFFDQKYGSGASQAVLGGP